MVDTHYMAQSSVGKRSMLSTWFDLKDGKKNTKPCV